jgi:hypothetical protein
MRLTVAPRRASSQASRRPPEIPPFDGCPTGGSPGWDGSRDRPGQPAVIGSDRRPLRGFPGGDRADALDQVVLTRAELPVKIAMGQVRWEEAFGRVIV